MGPRDQRAVLSFLQKLPDKHALEIIPYDIRSKQLFSKRLLQASEALLALPYSRETMLALRDRDFSLLDHPKDSESLLYEEWTTGSSGRRKRVIRPAHSLHRESLRLQHAIRLYAAHLCIPSPQTIIYFSHFSSSAPYIYFDHTEVTTCTIKLGHQFANGDYLQSLQEVLGGYILSGTPTSLMYLAQCSVGTSLTPAFILLAGEHCPQEVANRPYSPALADLRSPVGLMLAVERRRAA